MSIHPINNKFQQKIDNGRLKPRKIRISLSPLYFENVSANKEHKRIIIALKQLGYREKRKKKMFGIEDLGWKIKTYTWQVNTFSNQELCLQVS